MSRPFRVFVLLVALSAGAAAHPGPQGGHAEDPGNAEVLRYSRVAVLPPSGDLASDPHALVPVLRYDLYLPEGVDDAPFLVVLPGACVTAGASDFAGWGYHFASHGFAVVVLNYRNPCGLEEDHLREDVLAVLADALDPASTFVANSSLPTDAALLAPPLPARLDLQRVALLGHSLGAYVAIKLVGADGHIEVGATSLRVRALALWDPVCCHWGPEAQQPLRDLSVAVGVFTGDPEHQGIQTLDSLVDHKPGRYFDNVTDSSRFGMWAKHAQHVSMYQPEGPLEAFYETDLEPGPHFEEEAATPSHPEHQRLYRRYTSAFIRYEVTCEASMTTYLSGPHRTADEAAELVTVMEGSQVRPCDAH